MPFPVPVGSLSHTAASCPPIPREKFAVTPSKGEAVLFYHQTRAGHLDRKATHGACPVLKGEKWGANLWIWNKVGVVGRGGGVG